MWIRADWPAIRARVFGHIDTIPGKAVDYRRRSGVDVYSGQARFTGPALSPGAKLWSKAGWTSATRHDAAYIELRGGAKFVLVTFTTDHANDRDIIPAAAKIIVDGMSAK